jgi:hypothetical protein
MGLLRSICLTGFMVLGVGFAQPESINSSANLSKLLKVMSEVADEGPEMSYFGWLENIVAGPEMACAPATRDDAVRYLANLIAEMDWASSAQMKELNQIKEGALSDFRFLLKTDRLQRCQHSFSENMSFTRVVQFRNIETGYSVEFTEGYED